MCSVCAGVPEKAAKPMKRNRKTKINWAPVERSHKELKSAHDKDTGGKVLVCQTDRESDREKDRVRVCTPPCSQTRACGKA